MPRIKKRHQENVYHILVLRRDTNAVQQSIWLRSSNARRANILFSRWFLENFSPDISRYEIHRLPSDHRHWTCTYSTLIIPENPPQPEPTQQDGGV